MEQQSFARITQAEMAASVIGRAGMSLTKGELVPFSIRVPSWVLADLDGMATHSGTSRNQVINLVLRAGIEAITAHLSEAERTEISFLASDAMSTVRAQGKNESGEV